MTDTTEATCTHGIARADCKRYHPRPAGYVDPVMAKRQAVAEQIRQDRDDRYDALPDDVKAAIGTFITELTARDEALTAAWKAVVKAARRCEVSKHDIGQLATPRIMQERAKTGAKRDLPLCV